VDDIAGIRTFLNHFVSNSFQTLFGNIDLGDDRWIKHALDNRACCQLLPLLSLAILDQMFYNKGMHVASSWHPSVTCPLILISFPLGRKVEAYGLSFLPFYHFSLPIQGFLTPFSPRGLSRARPWMHFVVNLFFYHF